MDAAISKRMARFVELSKAFSKSEFDIFGELTKPNVINGSISIDSCSGHVCYSGEVSEPISKANQIRQEAEKKAKLMEDYEEYLQLQSTLADYFRITSKLTK